MFGKLRTLYQYQTNADLANFIKTSKKFPNIKEARKSIPIAVIDDQPFLPERNLRSYGFDIRQIGDVKQIDEVREFRVVLCDLMGVGVALGSQNEGAELIAEIRRQYPSILVAAYTGAPLNSAQARAAKSVADRVLKKDVDNSEWQEALDSFIGMALDPHLSWNRMRLSLVKSEVDTKSIIILEDAFVRTILSGDRRGARINQAVSRLNLGGDIRAVAQGLISSAVFYLTFGGGG